MNKIDFLKYTTFPLDSNTLDFMQEMIQTVVRMSAICGEKVIVSGCVVNGNKVGDGLVIVEGELLEFKGDVKVDKVYIDETREQVICLEETFDDLYIHRCVKFGNGDGVNNYDWSDFRSLDQIPELMNKITSLQSGKSNVGHSHAIADVTNLPTAIVPKGLIAMWSGSTNAIPTGWALCDGRTVDGVQTPDLRGRFIVGYDSNSTEYNHISAIGGAKEVTLTVAQIPRHSHQSAYSNPDTNTWKGGGNSRGGYTMYGDCSNDSSVAGGGGSHENRPPYYVLAYIIKL